MTFLGGLRYKWSKKGKNYSLGVFFVKTYIIHYLEAIIRIWASTTLYMRIYSYFYFKKHLIKVGTHRWFVVKMHGVFYCLFLIREIMGWKMIQFLFFWPGKIPKFVFCSAFKKGVNGAFKRGAFSWLLLWSTKQHFILGVLQVKRFRNVCMYYVRSLDGVLEMDFLVAKFLVKIKYLNFTLANLWNTQQIQSNFCVGCP